MLTATTIPELLEARASQSPEETAYWWRDTQGIWRSKNWRDFISDVNGLANGLSALGLSPGEAIGILAPTSLEWELAHLAAMKAGGVVVGLDLYELPGHLEHAVRISDVSIIFVDSRDRLAPFSQKIRARFRQVIELYPADGIKPEPGTTSLETLATPKQNPSRSKAKGPAPHEPATIIFTSGTTGPPRGITYRHEQLLFAVSSILETYSDIREGSRFACWLPLSNMFQRMVNLCAMGGGAQTYFVTDPRRVMEELPDICPTIFIAVPRFFEKLYEGFELELSKRPALVKRVVYFCLEHAEQPIEGEGKLGFLDPFIRNIFRPVARRLLCKFRGLFGENLRYLISGSAPMPLWLLRRLDAIGLLVLEAYGLSENTVPIAANRFSNYRFGTVGKSFPGNQIKLAGDRELLVKGPGVFEGYLNSDRSTRDSEGYLPTGDLAEIDRDGFIKLTGRKSEVFKTSTGRKVAPTEIEAWINQAFGVDQAAIFGAGKKYLIAVVSVTPHQSLTNGNSKATQVNDFSRDADALKTAISNRIRCLPTYKQPVGIIATTRPFSLVNNELTANLKLCRKTVENNYRGSIERLYEELENPGSAISKQPIMVDKETMLVKL